jgi:hypothetical protein
MGVCASSPKQHSKAHLEAERKRQAQIDKEKWEAELEWKRNPKAVTSGDGRLTVKPLDRNSVAAGAVNSPTKVSIFRPKSDQNIDEIEVIIRHIVRSAISRGVGTFVTIKYKNDEKKCDKDDNKDKGVSQVDEEDHVVDSFVLDDDDEDDDEDDDGSSGDSDLIDDKMNQTIGDVGMIGVVDLDLVSDDGNDDVLIVAKLFVSNVITTALNSDFDQVAQSEEKNIDENIENLDEEYDHFDSKIITENPLPLPPQDLPPSLELPLPPIISHPLPSPPLPPPPQPLPLTPQLLPSTPQQLLPLTPQLLPSAPPSLPPTPQIVYIETPKPPTGPHIVGILDSSLMVIKECVDSQEKFQNKFQQVFFDKKIVNLIGSFSIHEDDLGDFVGDYIPFLEQDEGWIDQQILCFVDVQSVCENNGKNDEKSEKNDVKIVFQNDENNVENNIDESQLPIPFQKESKKPTLEELTESIQKLEAFLLTKFKFVIILSKLDDEKLSNKNEKIGKKNENYTKNKKFAVNFFKNLELNVQLLSHTPNYTICHNNIPISSDEMTIIDIIKNSSFCTLHSLSQSNSGDFMNLFNYYSRKFKDVLMG